MVSCEKDFTEQKKKKYKNAQFNFFMAKEFVEMLQHSMYAKTDNF